MGKKRRKYQLKAVSKEHLLAYIQQNFDDESVIMEDDWKLKALWDQFSDEWFIEDGRWSLTTKCDKWGGKNN